jgi:hypothetical protein
MNPTVEAAWIAGSSGFFGVLVGVGGTSIVARLGFHSARDATEAGRASVLAQIEADRRNRIWERQSATYTDLIANIVHRQNARNGKMQKVMAGTWSVQVRRPAPVPVNWNDLGGTNPCLRCSSRHGEASAVHRRGSAI